MPDDPHLQRVDALLPEIANKFGELFTRVYERPPTDAVELGAWIEDLGRLVATTLIQQDEDER